jgi:hypothetical protein
MSNIFDEVEKFEVHTQDFRIYGKLIYEPVLTILTEDGDHPYQVKATFEVIIGNKIYRSPKSYNMISFGFNDYGIYKQLVNTKEVRKAMRKLSKHYNRFQPKFKHWYRVGYLD